MTQRIDQHSDSDHVDFRPLYGRRLFRRTLWLCRAHVLACLLLNLYVFVLLACFLQDAVGGGLTMSSYGFSESPLQWSTLGWVAALVILQVASFHGLMIASLNEDGQITLFPEDESGTRSFGGMRGEQIVSLVHEMAEQMKAGKIGKIVLLDSPSPNAQTVWLLGEGNIVTLHSNLLEVLSLDGIRSTIAHELAHVRRKDFLSRHLLFLPTRFVPCIFFLALLKIGAGFGVMASWPTFIGQSLVIALLVYLSWLAAIWTVKINIRISQFHEYLADSLESHTCGWQTALNTLLLLGDRIEAVFLLQSRLYELAEMAGDSLTENILLRMVRRFSPKELDDVEAVNVAPRLYIEDQLEQMRIGLKLQLRSKQIRNLAAQAARLLNAEEEDLEDEAEENEEDEQSLVDWREFDADSSGLLDPQEIAVMVDNLRENPGQMLFRQHLGEDAENESHPTMRQRVLFLSDLYQDDISKALS